jgi:hypothetical protein
MELLLPNRSERRSTVVRLAGPEDWVLPLALTVTVLVCTYAVELPISWRIAPITAALVIAPGVLDWKLPFAAREKLFWAAQWPCCQSFDSTMDILPRADSMTMLFCVPASGNIPPIWKVLNLASPQFLLELTRRYLVICR